MEGASTQQFVGSLNPADLKVGQNPEEDRSLGAFLEALFDGTFDSEGGSLAERQIDVISPAGSVASELTDEGGSPFDLRSLYSSASSVASRITEDPTSDNGDLDRVIIALLDLGEDDDVIRIHPDHIQYLIAERGQNMAGVADDIATALRKAKGSQFQEIICPGIVKIIEAYSNQRKLKSSLFVFLAPVLKSLSEEQREALLAAFSERRSAIPEVVKTSVEVLNVHPDFICDLINAGSNLPDLLQDAIAQSKGDEFNQIICPALAKAAHYYNDNPDALGAKDFYAFIALPQLEGGLSPDQKRLCFAAYEEKRTEVSEEVVVREDFWPLVSALDLYMTALSSVDAPSGLRLAAAERKDVSFDPSARVQSEKVYAPTTNPYILDLRDGQGSKKSPRVRQVVGRYIAAANDLELNYRIELAIAQATPHEYTHILCKGLVKAVHVYYLKCGREAFQLLGEIKSILATQTERLDELAREFEAIAKSDVGIREERSAFLNKCSRILRKVKKQMVITTDSLM